MLRSTIIDQQSSINDQLFESSVIAGSGGMDTADSGGVVVVYTNVQTCFRELYIGLAYSSITSTNYY